MGESVKNGDLGAMKQWTSLMGCLAVVLAVVGGCASTPKGPSDMEVLQGKIQECAAAANGKDIDKLMTYFADDFYASQIGDKVAFKDFLVNANAMGYLDGVEIGVKEAKTTISGNMATVTPVSVKGNFGLGQATFTATKGKNGWMITAMDISGI